MTFDTLGLSADLLRTVAEEGYTEPTPVQERAIPLVLQGKDILAAAQTGTGKTAAFTLPILDRLRPQANTSFSPARHPVRCLVLTPTRELAVQVETEVKRLGQYTCIKTLAVFGGQKITAQMKFLRHHPELLVGTPGRVIDLLERRDTERTSLEMVRKRPLPFPPEPVAAMGINATRWSLDRADHNEGRRNLLLKTLDALGLGFDS